MAWGSTLVPECLPTEYNSQCGRACYLLWRMLLAPETLCNHLELIGSPHIMLCVWAYSVCPDDLHGCEPACLKFEFSEDETAFTVGEDEVGESFAV